MDSLRDGSSGEESKIEEQLEYVKQMISMTTQYIEAQERHAGANAGAAATSKLARFKRQLVELNEERDELGLELGQNRNQGSSVADELTARFKD